MRRATRDRHLTDARPTSVEGRPTHDRRSTDASVVRRPTAHRCHLYDTWSIDDDVDDGEKWEEAEEQEEQENEIEIWTSTPAECSTYLSMSVFQCCLSTSGRNGSVWCLIGSSRTPPHTWSRTLLRRPRCFYQRNHRPGSHSPRASRLFYIFSLKTKQSIPWLMPSIPYNGSRKIVNFSELIGPLPCSRTGIAWRIPSLDLETAEMRWMITVIKPVVRVAELNKKMNQLDWQLTESLK